MKVRSVFEVKRAFCIYPIVFLLFFVFSIIYVRRQSPNVISEACIFIKTSPQALGERKIRKKDEVMRLACVNFTYCRLLLHRYAFLNNDHY